MGFEREELDRLRDTVDAISARLAALEEVAEAARDCAWCGNQECTDCLCQALAALEGQKDG